MDVVGLTEKVEGGAVDEDQIDMRNLQYNWEADLIDVKYRAYSHSHLAVAKYNVIDSAI